MSRYVLMTSKVSKYDGFMKNNFRLFDTYYDLQKFLAKYWFVEKNKYYIFVETELSRDYSTNDIKKEVY